ncbi:DNA repair protein RecO [Legionella sp. W05-934-2]|jgi:DNA repair protein RecO (recombination protein O)|uniref:DNA repair protein RecO n=1 Tax=Legionella sp. W05-934-2 TaxID=1198649 RepID=UPI0034633A6F
MTSRTLSGWLIHAQPSGETASYLSILTEEKGLIQTRYPGGQSRKRKMNLQLFTPLWIELQQRGQMHYCQSIEIKSQPPVLSNLALSCAYYINELIYKTLKQPEIDNHLYTVYEQSLLSLQQTQEQTKIERLLRQFEWSLLVSQGHSYSFELEGDQQTAIDITLNYLFQPGYGFYPSPQGFSGQTLLSIAQNGLADKTTLSVAKRIMRQAIDYLVDYQPIHARKMFMTHHPENNTLAMDRP